MLILVKKLIGTLFCAPILSYYLKLDNSLIGFFLVFGGEAYN